ncbi:MAG: enoyl-CoA hydratase/isomerase family protein [Chloroflexi bacterium]|nr:enoyl-CoA hydratase/isomerase family protein [Chloroflexota bacterium]
MADYSSYQAITVQNDGKVATVTLNRPERLNAISHEMHDELEGFFGSVNNDAEINAIILTGAGRAFCAGGDMSDAGGPKQEDAPPVPVTFGRSPRKLILNMLEVEAPIIAAVNGVAVGLGATLALLADVIIASENARLADTHVKMGLVAGDGGAVIWPLLVGVHRAKEYLLTGDFISATEAERIGLINHVVPPEELMAKAQDIAGRLAAGPMWAMRWTKASINKVIRERMNLILDTSLAYEALSSATDDHREAASSFFEKREPKFTGR